MARIAVIRHSIAVANEQGILMGAKFESSLSKRGVAVARHKGQQLRSVGFMPDKVFSSTLTRAQETAQIICEELGVSADITTLTELNERDFGQYDGKPYKFVLEAFEKYGDNPPGIEPVKVFVRRVASGWKHIKQETTATTLVVTHSNPEMVLQTITVNPANVQRFWELGDPPYCEGFIYEF